MIIHINGTLIEENSATIPLISDAFLFGEAVFETLRTYNGTLFRLDDHLERFKASIQTIELKFQWNLNQIKKEIAVVLEKSPWPDVRMRLIASSMGLIIMTQGLDEKPSSMYKEGVKAVRFDGQRSFPTVKKVGDLLCYKANQFAKKNGAYESILVNLNGEVTEGGYSNVFWVKNDQLFTTNMDILKGITRQTVLELAENCAFETILFKNLLQTDEIFITQSTSGILPVVEVEGQVIGEGVPGFRTRDLMQAFRKRTAL